MPSLNFRDYATMEHKATTRHDFVFVDWRKTYANVHNGEAVVPAPQRTTVTCTYCRSEHYSSSCPNCGAPK